MRKIVNGLKIQLVIEDKIIVSVRDVQKISLTLLAVIKKTFTYKNPKFIENEKWGYSNHATPEYLKSYKLLDSKLFINRGGLDKLLIQFKKFGVAAQIVDHTLTLPMVEFEQSNTILRPDQEIALNEMLKHDNGLLQAYTSFGKTITLLELIRRIKQPALVMVHTTFLQKQWLAEATASHLFNLDKKLLGGVGGIFTGKKRKLGLLNICLYHSLTKKQHLNFFKDKIGLIIIDEGQKASIEDIQSCSNAFRAKYRYAASASFRRKDKKEFLIYDTVGPVRYVAEEQASDSKILSNIKIVRTGFKSLNYKDDSNYTSLITEMAVNRARNIFIAKLAVREVKKGNLTAIFVERKIQAAILAKYLSKFKVGLLLGPVNKSDVDNYLELTEQDDFKNSGGHIPLAALSILKKYDDKTAYDTILAKAKFKELDIVIGTQKMEVGLSIRSLDSGIVTTPMGNNLERFNQAIGRFERTYDKEQVKVFGDKKTPTVYVLKDSVSVSKNASMAIKEMYSDRIL